MTTPPHDSRKRDFATRNVGEIIGRDVAPAVQIGTQTNQPWLTCSSSQLRGKPCIPTPRAWRRRGRRTGVAAAWRRRAAPGCHCTPTRNGTRSYRHLHDAGLVARHDAQAAPDPVLVPGGPVRSWTPNGSCKWFGTKHGSATTTSYLSSVTRNSRRGSSGFLRTRERGPLSPIECPAAACWLSTLQVGGMGAVGRLRDGRGATWTMGVVRHIRRAPNGAFRDSRLVFVFGVLGGKLGAVYWWW